MRFKGFLKALLPTAVLVLALAQYAFASYTVEYVEDFDSTFTANQFNTSQIFTGGQDNGTYSQSTDGYNGGTTAVNVKANGANVNSYIGTKALSTFGLSQDSAVVLTARFKFVGNSTANFYWRTDPSSNTNESWRIYGGDDGKYHLWSQTATDTLQGDKWYNISIKIDTAYNYTYIYDAETGEQVAYKKAENPSGVAGKQFLFRFYSLTDGGIIFDDAKMYSQTSASTEATLQSSTISDGDTEIARNTGVELCFDQPITDIGLGNIVITGEGVTEESYVVRGSDMFTCKIVFKELLKKNAEYTIDLSGLGLDSITFTTGGIYILDADCSAEVDTENNKKLNVTYMFNENSGIEKIGCRMMGILYKDGKMIDVATFDIIPTAANVNTEKEATLIFSEEIDGSTNASIVFFESGAYIPMSTGISCD